MKCTHNYNFPDITFLLNITYFDIELIRYSWRGLVDISRPHDVVDCKSIVFPGSPHTNLGNKNLNKNLLKQQHFNENLLKELHFYINLI